MPKEKRDTTALNVRLSTEVCERLTDFCKESGLTKTRAVERILNKYFDNYFERPESERQSF